MSDMTDIDPNTVRELERARADLVTLRAELKTAKSELTSSRAERDEAFKARDGFKGQLEKQKSEYEARLTEASSANEALRAENEAAIAEVRTAGDKALLSAKAEAVATRMGAHDPADVVRLADLASVTRGDDGSFIGLTEALEAAKESKGYLFGEAPKTGAEHGTTQTQRAPKPNADAPKVTEMTDTEYRAAEKAFLAGAR